MNNQILVTGGAGYIVSHHRVPVYGHRDLVKWGPFEEGDITDSTRLDDVMEKYQPDAVLHFADFAKQIVTLAKVYVFSKEKISCRLKKLLPVLTTLEGSWIYQLFNQCNTLS